MAFCTVINCMDGRIQIPVIQYLQNRFNVPYVDSITEPGPNKILADNENPMLINSIFKRLNISVEKHNSSAIAVVGHHDCAGNPVPYQEQVQHLKQAVKLLKEKYPHLPVIALWVNEDWQVQEIDT